MPERPELYNKRRAQQRTYVNLAVRGPVVVYKALDRYNAHARQRSQPHANILIRVTTAFTTVRGRS